MSEPRTTFLAAVPQFGVQDVQRTAEYYRDVLGFRVRSYWDGERRTAEPLNTPVFAIVDRDQVEFFFYRAPAPLRQVDGGYHAYFHVDGVDTLAQQLRANGAEILDGPQDMSYGQREIVVRDPNGLILAFGESIDQNAYS